MFRHELSKLATLRSIWMWAAAVVSLSMGIAALMAFAFASDEMAYSGDALGLMQMVARTTSPSLYFSAVLGIVAMRSDAREGVLRLTLVRAPGRTIVFIAKVASVALASGGVCLLTAVSEAVAIGALFGALPLGGVTRAVALHVAIGVGWALIGLCVGTLIEQLLPAVLVALAPPVLIEPAVNALLGPERSTNWLPFGAGYSLYGHIGGNIGADPGAAGSLVGVWPFVAFIAMLALAAKVRFAEAEF